MKIKTINKVLNSKFNEWVQSITNPSVKELVEDNSIITGGCIASMLLKEKINDFDVYFTNKETVLAVARYYTAMWNKEHLADDGYVLDGADASIDDTIKAGGIGLNLTPDRVKIVFKSKGVVGEQEQESSDVEDFINPEDLLEDLSKVSNKEYKPIFISSNAITLSNAIQIVIRFYGDPDNIHQHYDYMHCTNYWLSKTKQLTLKQPALECLLTKELIYVGSKYPIASIVRLRKFITRGWTVNAGQILKISYQISLLDLNDIAVLEDQLTGVDVAYFIQLVDALAEHKKKNPDFVLTYSYLMKIIDRIF